MNVRLRLSDKSTSSQEQDDDVKSDVSSTDEVETIPKTMPPKRLQRVTIETEEKTIDVHPRRGPISKNGTQTTRLWQWQAILRDPERERI